MKEFVYNHLRLEQMAFGTQASVGSHIEGINDIFYSIL